MTNFAPTKFQREMMTAAIAEHVGCCTANSPCHTRAYYTQTLAADQLRPDVKAAGPEFDRKTLAPVRDARTPGRAPTGGGKTPIGGKLASEKQVSFINSLVTRKGFNLDFDDARPVAELTAREASKLIDTLLAMPDAPREPKPTCVAQPQAVTEDGMYRTLDGTVYKVQIAKQGSGRLYAKQLVEAGGEWSFEYAAGAIRKLTPAMRMSLADAKAFGRLYGVCCRCSAVLTDEVSIEAGIGRYCAGRM